MAMPGTFSRSLLSALTSLGICVVLVALDGAVSLVETSTAAAVSAGPDRTVREQACNGKPCMVSLTKVTTLLEDSYKGTLPDSTVCVVPQPGGRYLTRSRTGQALVLFDNSGRIETLVEVPGTTRALTGPLAGLKETTLVYDGQGRRLISFGADLKTPRISSFRYVPSFVRLDGTFIVAQQIQTPELVGHPIHLVGSDGKVLRSFGAETPEYHPSRSLSTDRIVAPGRNASVWAAPRGRYVIEQWAPVTGQRLSHLSVKSSWFTESTGTRTSNQTRPQPILVSIWEQADKLWVLLRVADASWKAPKDNDAERPYDVEAYSIEHDWMLEVVDAQTGGVLASERYDRPHWACASSPFVVSRPPSRPGRGAALEVWKPELRGR
jgi:hypothetical protein